MFSWQIGLEMSRAGGRTAIPVPAHRLGDCPVITGPGTASPTEQGCFYDERWFRSRNLRCNCAWKSPWQLVQSKRCKIVGSCRLPSRFVSDAEIRLWLKLYMWPMHKIQTVNVSNANRRKGELRGENTLGLDPRIFFLAHTSGARYMRRVLEPTMCVIE